jgi:Tol biopolymer transport system component
LPDVRSLELLHLATGRKTTVVADDGLQFRNAHFSPDQKWILFEVQRGPEKQQIVAARNDRRYPIASAGWIPITDGSTADSKPNWSPGADAVYFLSDRDSFPCLWMQRVDLSTRKPVGPAIAVKHFHNARLSPSNVLSSSINVGRNELLVTLGERTGNVWWMDLP